MDNKDKRKEMARRILTARAGIVLLQDGERLEDGYIGAAWGDGEMVLKQLHQAMLNISEDFVKKGVRREELVELLHNMADEVKTYLQERDQGVHETANLPS